MLKIVLYHDHLWSGYGDGFGLDMVMGFYELLILKTC